MNDLLGCGQINGHLVFYIKLGENFFIKSKCCSGLHKTRPPMTSTYSTILAQDYVMIMLLAVALNGISVLGEEVHNTFL